MYQMNCFFPLCMNKKETLYSTIETQTEIEEEEIQPEIPQLEAEDTMSAMETQTEIPQLEEEEKVSTTNEIVIEYDDRLDSNDRIIDKYVTVLVLFMLFHFYKICLRP